MAESENYLVELKTKLEEIEKLQETPMIMRDYASDCLKRVLNESQQLLHTDRNIIQNKVKSLENIKEESMKAQFSVIYSQMCVLAVSSLEAILKKYFVDSINDSDKINTDYKKLAEIKVSVRDIIENKFNFDGKLGGLILERDKPNFQDLKSILKNLKNYFNQEIYLKDGVKQKICFYLEARHLLVHKGGVVDEKFINNTGVLSANIKNYDVGDTVEFDSSDWIAMKGVFLELVDIVTKEEAGVTVSEVSQ